jgi:hypothetical protein
MTDNPRNPNKPDESGINLYLRNLEQTLLNRDWLETRSKFELMDLVQFLAVQLYKQSTAQLKPRAKKEPEAKFPMVEAPSGEVFEPVPFIKPGGESIKVLLVGSKTSPLNIGYQIYGKAIIGRDDGSNNVDIDLTRFGPEVKGVSRQHAEFRLSGNKLYVVDLGSSNGTYLRGRRLEPDQAVEVPGGSVISFGALHVQVQIIRE